MKDGKTLPMKTCKPDRNMKNVNDNQICTGNFEVPCVVVMFVDTLYLCCRSFERTPLVLLDSSSVGSLQTSQYVSAMDIDSSNTTQYVFTYKPHHTLRIFTLDAY